MQKIILIITGSVLAADIIPISAVHKRAVSQWLPTVEY